jgi:hypothetical protein
MTGQGTVRPAFTANEWEAHVAAVPRRVLVDELGGFSEDYDLGWTYDNCNVADRAAYLGHQILVAEDVEVRGFDHKLFFPNPIDRPELLNARRHYDEMRAIWRGEKPPKYGFVEATCSAGSTSTSRPEPSNSI